MILAEICAKSHIRASAINPEIIVRAEDEKRHPLNIKEAFDNCSTDKNAVIAEIKYKTPSDKSINSQKKPNELAGIYEAGGACAISVLTEPFFFEGSVDYLMQVKESTKLPVLRKDFIVSKIQIYESYVCGADSVLLISKVLKENLKEYISLCHSFAMEPLVEVRSSSEAENALNSDAKIVGINNRNLVDMKIDLNKTKEISEILSDSGVLAVSESGIKTNADISALKKYCNGFLIGTALMKAKDPKEVLEGFVFA